MTPLWLDAIVAALVVASGLTSVVAAWGMRRMPSFFARMHAPAIASTFGVWAAAAASALYFSALEGEPVLHMVVIPAILAVTLPLTTVLLSRAALFRKRLDGANIPPPLGGR